MGIAKLSAKILTEVNRKGAALTPRACPAYKTTSSTSLFLFYACKRENGHTGSYLQPQHASNADTPATAWELE